MITKAVLPSWLPTNPLPFSAVVQPKWLLDFRLKHWDAFQKHGLPTQSNERWKYADLSFLKNKKYVIAPKINNDYLGFQINRLRLKQGNSIRLVFINGHFIPHLSDLNKLLPGMIVCSLDKAFQQYSELIKKYWSHNINASLHPFANLNAALFTDGLFFYLPPQCELSMPVHLLYIAAHDQAFITHPHHLMVLSENSKLTLVEEFTAMAPGENYLLNVANNMLVGKHARLEHIKIQAQGNEAVHMAHTLVKQMPYSKTEFTHFSSGSSFARDDLIIKLEGQGAECDARGFYHLRQHAQYVDHHIDIDHLAPNTQSKLLYKGILEGKTRLVFNGKLHVDKNAQKIIAHQSNHNLLLSSEAEVYSKPELEIYADDVKCKHGATTGQLDQEALFYLCSRGISQDAAKMILLQAFADEILQRIIYPGLKEHLKKMV